MKAILGSPVILVLSQEPPWHQVLFWPMVPHWAVPLPRPRMMLYPQARICSSEDVANLFIGDSDKGNIGLGDILNDKLTEMTRSTGLVNGEKTAAEEKNDRLTTSIETATERLDKKYELMAQQFVRLDTLIDTMNSQPEYLTSMFESFNNAQE